VHSVSLEQAVNSAQQDPSKHVWQAGVWEVKPHLASPPPAPHSAPQEPPMQSRKALYLTLLLHAASGFEEVAQLLQSTSSKQALSTSQHLASTQPLQVGKPSGETVNPQAFPWQKSSVPHSAGQPVSQTQSKMAK
jgi:hypothetical protein